MSETSPVLTVIIPVFNEAQTLRRAVDRLLATELPLPVQTVVVDDGSTDGGLATVSDLERSGALQIIRQDRNRGKGSAVRTGLAHARGELATILDADLEYDPRDYALLLEPLLQGSAKVAFGTRSFGSHTAYSFWYVLGNKLLAFWASFLFNSWLSDIETCFKMAPTAVWRSLDLRSRGFGLEAEATAKLLRQGHRIYEVPIHYSARGRLEGKKLRWTDGVAALWILFRIRVFGR